MYPLHRTALSPGLAAEALRSSITGGVRRLRRHPLISVALVLALALGVGGSATALHFAGSGWSAETPVLSPAGVLMPPRLAPLVSAPPADGPPEIPPGAEMLGTGGRRATTLGTIAEVQAEGVRGLLLLTGGAAAILLLVTCVNIALLLFSTGRARRGEVAMRHILGAGRRRIAGLLLLEQLPLVLLAATIAAGIFAISAEALRQSWPDSLTNWLSGEILPAQIALVAAAPLLTLAFFGVLPVLLTREYALAEAIVGGARVTSSPHEGLIRDRATVLGVGLSMTLMIAAGLLLEGFSNQLAGFSYPVETRDTLTFTIRPAPVVNAPAAAGAERFSLLASTLESLGSVEVAALGSEGAWLGLGTTALAHSLTGVPGRPGITRPTRYSAVAPGSLSALGLRIESGRDFTAADRAGATAAVVVSRTFANRFFLGEAVGQRLQLGRAAPNGTWFSVIGVVEDLRPVGIGNGEEPQPMLMLSAAQAPPATFDLVARYIGEPVAARLEIERALTSALPDATVTYTGTLEEKLTGFAAPFAWFGWIVALLAAFTTLLSSFSLHSMIAFNVARRTRELGIRIALGARARDVVRQVLREAGRLTVRGSVLGLAGGLCAGRFLQFTFTGVDVVDPAVYGAALTLTIITSTAASYFPARAATRIEPVSALAHE